MKSLKSKRNPKKTWHKPELWMLSDTHIAGTTKLYTMNVIENGGQGYSHKDTPTSVENLVHSNAGSNIWDYSSYARSTIMTSAGPS
jgi:hypothetical protein